MRLYLKALRLRYLFRTQMVCPLGLHRYRSTYLQIMMGLQATGSDCVFCGHHRAERQAS